nr:aldo/keto reductase [Frankia sp. AgB32]
MTASGSTSERSDPAAVHAPTSKEGPWHPLPPAQVGLAWLLHHAPNVLLIPGTADPEHLMANVAAGSVSLDSTTLAALDARHSAAHGS